MEINNLVQRVLNKLTQISFATGLFVVLSYLFLSLLVTKTLAIIAILVVLYFVNDEVITKYKEKLADYLKNTFQ